MNYRMILRVLGMILLCIAALMLLPLITGLCFGEDISNFIKTILITAIKSTASGAYLNFPFVIVFVSIFFSSSYESLYIITFYF